MVAIGSAVAGGLVVLLVSLLVRPALAPIAPADPVLAQTGGEVALDLVPVFEVDEEAPDPREARDPQPDTRRRNKRDGGQKRRRRDRREPASATPLTRAVISTGIKANLGKLGPCFRQARRRKELTPGRHPIVVAFRIQPNGSVDQGALTGPSYLAGKRVAKCVATRLRAWKFQPSSKGAPVRDLRLPINVQ
jgi:hypothetical protein